MYKDINDYAKLSKHGRTYWGMSVEDEFNYHLSLEETRSQTFSRIKLTGCNWLSTVTPNWFNYKGATKDIDVFAVFAFPAKENKEFGNYTNGFYDEHRKRCISWLNQLPESIKVAKLEEGKRIPIEEYYNLMSRSKIVVAPFGYGEIAPRDIEAAMVGAILIKPEMSHLQTIPNPFISQKTYSSVKWDFSNLNSEIQILLTKFNSLQEYYVENMRKVFIEQYNPEKLVIHTHKWLSELDGFGTD